MLTISRKFSRVCINFLERRNLNHSFCTAQIKLTEDSVEEIRIPVPWGHIAGKWWGNKSIIPVVAIHGWQDNANTFDKLIPLLNLPSILAIDLPGHGLSSHFPEGIAYDFEEYLIVLHRIIKYYGWPQVPLLGHSLGGALGYAYSAIFPDKVKWYINLECARSLMTIQKLYPSHFLSQEINTFLKIEKQKKLKSVPAYKLSTMVRMSIEGSLGSISSPEAALTLVKRGIYPVPKPPNNTKKTKSYGSDLQQFINIEKQAASSLSEEEKKKLHEIYLLAVESLNKAREQMKNFDFKETDDKYYSFAKDPSTRVQVLDTFDEECLREASRSIKCPFLSLRASYGFLHGSTRKLYEETLAKWWGLKSNKPVLCCHGWQDNANTFDTLIPYLPPQYSYLSIDLLGHGLSSHFPKGLFYRTYDAVALFRRIQLYFKWSKFSFIGHSYGAACGFLFSSCFPKSVDFLVAIDTIKPLSRNPESAIKKGSEVFEKMLINDNLSAETAPAYTKDELMKRWIKGSRDSLTEKSCEILLKRGVEEKNGLFKLTRDVRLKTSLGPCYSQKEILLLANSVACNVLFIKAKDAPYYEEKETVLSVLEVIKKKAKYFERHDIPGTHHLHLNNPEVIAPVINSFIKTVESNSST